MEKENGHDGDPSRCGWKDTLLEGMYLTRLVRVSAASWQPEIFVEELQRSPPCLPPRCLSGVPSIWNGTQF